MAADTDNANEARDDSSAPSESPPKPPARDYAVESAHPQRSDIPDYASVKKGRKSGSFPSRPEFVYKPDHSEVKMTCLRSLLLIINLFIWALGAVMAGLGIWIKVDPTFLDIQSHLDMKQFGAASTVLIIVGVVVMIVGIIGCHGVIAAKMCSLVIFSIVIAILILLEIAIMAIVWSAVTNKNFQEDIRLKATVAMEGMMKDTEKQYFFSLLQTKLKCCGVNGPKDYNRDLNNPRPIPNSCYERDSGQPFTDGCYDKVVDYLKSKAAAVGGIAAAVFLLQLGILVFTIFFMCGMKTSNAIL